MALNSWQKLTRVLPGKPFGTGLDGDYSSATAPTLTKDSCSGTATSTTLTTSGSTFANGDILLLYQTRGTGAGQWEINKVASGGGTANLTLAVALQYTYTDSGASQAQAIKIPMYKDVTVQSGTWSPTAWNQNVGGVFIVAASGLLTITGNVSMNQSGFYGGANPGTNSNGMQGEGDAGAGTASTNRNGNGGGGGYLDTGSSKGRGGNGGGNGLAGSTNPRGYPGEAGTTSGNDGLTLMSMGGGGGSGADYGGGAEAQGGKGGGTTVWIAKEISIAGVVSASGQDGPTNGAYGAGGGGAGGSHLFILGSGAIGTDKITCTGGAAGISTNSNFQDSGAGGKGRIAVYYGTSLTGSISSSLYGTYTNELDTTLKESSGSMWLMF